METARLVCPSLSSEAKSVYDRFTSAFNKFAECHKIYNSNYVKDSEIDKLGMYESFT